MTSRAVIVPRGSATIAALRDKTIAVLGYGSQGCAHALNLRDSGLNVVVAQRPHGPRYDQARADGFDPIEIEPAIEAADLIILALPDDAAGAIYADRIRAHIRSGQTLGFIHGFVIHYQQIKPPDDLDVVLVAPKAQGRGVRDAFCAGRGVAALIAVHQGASGAARQTALAWAAGIGSHRAGIIETTFADETETDLFGEQAVLCGGLSALIKTGYETLVEAGYPPELAYFECCHEIKLLADLICEGGITYMRERISSTARFGDLTRGPRVIGPEVRRAMRELLEQIRSGRFANEFLEDIKGGGTVAQELTDKDRTHPIEHVGRTIRQMINRR